MVRRLFFLAIVLVLGVLTTVGVAWTAAAFAPPPRRVTMTQIATSGRRPAHLSVYEARRFGGCRRAWFAEPSMGCGNPYMYFRAAFPPGPTPAAQPLTGWGDYAAFEASFRLHGGFGRGQEDAVGWPRPALWCSLDTRQGTLKPRGGRQLGPDQNHHGLLAYRVLPYRPLWGGLAVNSAVFAAGWAVLLVVPLRVRARRRRRGGCCPACRYDLAGLPPDAACPECGTPR